MIEPKNSTSKAATVLRDWRTQTNTSRRALATRIGVTFGAVKLWELGRSFPRNAQCERLYAATQLDCFGADRISARDEHERLIPRAVKKKWRADYLAHAPERRKRSREAWRKSYEAHRQRVTKDELTALRADPRKRKNICRECGVILRDVGPHLWPSHRMKVSAYKENWGFNRSRNATRSESTNEKQSAAMLKSGHQPPKWTRKFLPQAVAASLETNLRNSARLEERLNARGKRLAARPRHQRAGATDARIARLKLASRSEGKIAAAVGLSLGAISARLKRMNYSGRREAFLHGEVVDAHHVRAYRSDFSLTMEEVAADLHVRIDTAYRLMNMNRDGRLSLSIVSRFLRVRQQRLVDFRRKPASKQGGRPKQLTKSGQEELVAKFPVLLNELDEVRSWLRRQSQQPSMDAFWKWLCERFRSGELGLLHYWPAFFDWLTKSYEKSGFLSGQWAPHDLTTAFIATDFSLNPDSVKTFRFSKKSTTSI